MPVLGVFTALDEQGDTSVASWIRDLAVMLTQEGVHTLVVATRDTYSNPLLDPLEQDEVQAGALPTLSDVYGTDDATTDEPTTADAIKDIEPYAVPAYPGLTLLPDEPKQFRLGSLKQQARLVDWIEQRDETVRIVPLGGGWSCAPLVECCTHFIVLAEPSVSALQRVRDLGQDWAHLKRPTCYAVLRSSLPPHSSDERALARRREQVEAALPGAFRAAWLGQHDVDGLTARRDHLAVGVVNTPAPTPRPAWRMARDQGVTDSQGMQARDAAYRQAHRLAAFLELDLALSPPSPAPAAPSPLPAIQRVVGPEDAARVDGFRSHGRYPPVEEWVQGHRITVLLGEAGVGKTHASKALAELLPGAVRIDLREPNLAEALELGVLPDTRTVILDGLDEHPALERASFLQRLELFYRGHDYRLVLLSRPHQYVLNTLSPILESWVATEQFARGWLLPLSQEEARQMALGFTTEAPTGEATRLDANQVWLLFNTIRATDLAGLAARPLTLRLLLARMVDGLSLTADRDTLFSDMIARLAYTKGGDPAPVLKAARALAWATIVGEYGNPAQLPDADFCAAFGIERQPFEAALERFGQVHRRFWEHLAADWALENRLSAARLRQVLTVDGQSIADRFKYVAARLVARNAALAGLLVDADPALLLELGVQVPPAHQLRWLRALIRAHQRGDVALHYRGLSPFRVATLDDAAPLLAEVHGQLKTAGPTLREALVPLLTLGGSTGIAQLVAIATDASEGTAVRRAALYALPTDEVEPHRPALAALWRAHPESEIRERLLPLLWPVGLTSIELIRHTPFSFNARYFSKQHAEQIIDGLTIAELPEALNWAAARPWRAEERHPDLGRIWPLVFPLIERAWQVSSEAPVRSALAGFLLAWANRRFDRLAVDWGCDPRRLWQLIREIVRQATEVRPLQCVLQHFSFRYSRVLPWLVADMERSLAEAPAEFERWRVIWARVWNWGEQMPRVAALATQHAGLAERLTSLGQPRPTRYEPPAREMSDADRGRPLIDHVRECLAHTDRHPSAWVPLSTLFTHPEVISSATNDANVIAESVLWPALDPDERETTLSMARAFLAADDWTVGEVLENWRWAEGASQAWLLLLSVDQPIPRPIWLRWLPLLLSWQPLEADIGRRIRQALGKDFEGEVLNTLATFEGPRASAFEMLEPYWFAALNTNAFERLRAVPEDDNDRRQMERLLALLLRHSRDQALTWAEPHFELGWVLTTCLASAPQHTWDRIWPRFSADPAFAAHLLDAGTTPRFGNVTRWWDAGDPERMTTICERLHTRFPDPDRPTGVVYTPTHADTARRAISAIVSELIRLAAVEQVQRLNDMLDLPAGYVRRARRHRARSRLDMRALAQFKPQPDSASALKWLLVDTLREIQAEDLDGPISVREIFFVRCPDKKDRRLGEVRACHLLGKLLALRLPDVQIVLEPQVSEGRMRLDVTVLEGRARVILEVKWADHRDIHTALPDQLGKYLDTHQGAEPAEGLYLVLWYTQAMVRTGKYPIPTQWRDPEDLAQHLRAQADADGRIEPVILQFRHPRARGGKA